MEKRRDVNLSEDKARNNKLWRILILCLLGLLLNLICNWVVTGLFNLPLYMDTVGTICVACLGGSLPGIVVALFTNLILGFGNSESIYFGVLNVLIAVVASYWLQSGKRRKIFWSMALFAFVIACIGGGIGACQTWVFSGFSTEGANGSLILFFYEKCGFNQFWAQFMAAFLYDVLDKVLSTVLCLLLIWRIPKEMRRKLRFSGWKQMPLDSEQLATVKGMKRQSFSLGTKIVSVLMIMFIGIAVVVVSISLVLFRGFSENQHGLIARGVAELAASVIDAEKVDEYLEKGESVEGYLETKEMLTRIRDSYRDVDYVYVYRIEADGCHVVFDPDTEDMPGDPVGSVIEFDPSFLPYLDSLLKGEKIETIISDDKYGWLLTEYEPIYDQSGKCVCYAAADVSMKDIQKYENDFLMKLASLFLGFFALLLAISIWLSTYHLVYPINTMAYVTETFNYDSEEARKKNVERLQMLGIHTKDEIENLYDAFLKTTEDGEKSFAELLHKTDMLAQLQSGLIMMLADMVENRDQSTGDHIRKTAAYAMIVMEKMREKGYYAEQLTDQYITNVVKSAPLHDIGKIQVSDTILNKPGKLTDEEFEIMKTHTTAGKKIIEQTITTMPEADYLKEAEAIAYYHHEKWNGKEYPCGLAGEEIPLSARVMAVADVFDALVSKRCYKEPFSFEKAMSIIEEGAGSHFDPKVADAFLASGEEVRRIAERFENMSEAESREFFSRIS